MVDAAAAARLARPLVGDVAAVTREGAGWDHVAWRVDAADGTAWIVRAASLLDPGDTDVGDVGLEVAVMQAARRRLGDLVADAVVLDATLGCMAYPRLAGVPLQQLLAAGAVPEGELRRLAGEIGGLVAAIGAIGPGGVDAAVPVDDDTFGSWFAELPAFVAEIGDLLSPGERAAVDRFVATEPPADVTAAERVLAHNDLGAEHVLVDPATLAITGVIDWSDAAVADPAAEVGRLLRDIGAAQVDAVLDGIGARGAARAGLVVRGWCYARCLVLEDLAYAVRNRPDFVAFEHASLARLFAGV
jgi:aminoglycoside phosphotransferase (APT) family kinase protein